MGSVTCPVKLTNLMPSAARKDKPLGVIVTELGANVPTSTSRALIDKAPDPPAGIEASPVIWKMLLFH